MEHCVWEYRRAEVGELERIWDKNIAAHPGDDRWRHWRDLALRNHKSGRLQTFCVFRNGEPVGEGTLMFSPECEQIGGRTDLADNKTIANINGLRIERAYEGQGHISRLFRVMENHAQAMGFGSLSVGVEARETRNLSIYLHLGYRGFIRHDAEDGVLVLYYRKIL